MKSNSFFASSAKIFDRINDILFIAWHGLVWWAPFNDTTRQPVQCIKEKSIWQICGFCHSCCKQLPSIEGFDKRRSVQSKPTILFGWIFFYHFYEYRSCQMQFNMDIVVRQIYFRFKCTTKSMKAVRDFMIKLKLVQSLYNHILTRK